MSAQETEFEFDDFFVSENDPGVPEELELEDNNGVKHTMEWYVRRNISLGDIQQARYAATSSHLTPDGKQVADGFDDALFAINLLANTVKSWPFKRNGVMVPVTVAYVTRLNARNSEVLNILANKLTKSGKSEETKQDFEKPSDVAF